MSAGRYIGLVEDECRVRMIVEQTQDLCPLQQSAIGIVRVTKPAEIHIGKISLAYVLIRRIEADFVLVHPTSILIFGKRRNGYEASAPSESLCYLVEGRRGSVGYKYGVIVHAVPLGKHLPERTGIRLGVVPNTVEVFYQMFLQMIFIAICPDSGTEIDYFA